MAPYQFIDRPTPFNTKGGKTLPIFAVTPAHIETGTIDPIALDWARKAGYKAESGSVLLIPTAETVILAARCSASAPIPRKQPFLTGKLARTLPAGDGISRPRR
jgi:leucyl aminopeptidase